MIRENIIITVRKNLCSPKASGSEIFDTHNSETRNRQHQPSVQAQPTVQLANQISQNKSKIFTYGKRSILIISITIYYNSCIQTFICTVYRCIIH
ncbi:hypothetical protein GLOIN_2v1786510 [Rhizophagus irregularis DAOM 181602=DAOM 197198]|nr:hypothetical protein GLOIN_2v1786510 [Rhizophagus irregularis DAOM 181602=DAOM 197198]